MRRAWWAFMLAAVVAACGGASEREVTAGIRAVTTLDSVPPFAEGISWPVLQAIYEDNDYRPIWVDGEKPSERARELVDAIATADAEGLRMRDYPLTALRDALLRAYEHRDTRPSEIAEVDLRLTALYLAYGADMIAGRLDPRLVDGSWYIRTRQSAADSALRTAVQADDFGDMLAQLRPEQPDYTALLGELRRYRAVAEAGGWPTIDGGALRPSERGARVTALRQRLAASGDLDSSAMQGDAFDDGLHEALARFRVRHNLEEATGVDAATLQALNVPVADRIRQIEVNLDRLRWLPKQFGERYVMVNIPNYELHAYDGGREVLTMRVVVGKEYETATPVFADTMSMVVFGPEWNVPRSIATQEIIPKARESEAYLARNNYEVLDATTGEVVDPRDVDWDADTADFGYRIRQKTGAGNALGNVKFLFPNQFAIYMHDTPTQSTFNLRDRAASHGCVRLQDPVAFAEYVLGGAGWDRGRIERAMETTTPVEVAVSPAIPVYLVYLTAFERDGVVHFRDDVYGSDRKALARLDEAEEETTLQAVSEAIEGLMKG